MGVGMGMGMGGEARDRGWGGCGCGSHISLDVGRNPSPLLDPEGWDGVAGRMGFSIGVCRLLE